MQLNDLDLVGLCETFNSNIKLAHSDSEKDLFRDFTNKQYKKSYPDMFDSGIGEDEWCFFGTDKNGAVSSGAKITFSNEIPLISSGKVKWEIERYINSGVNLAYIGSFNNLEIRDQNISKAYFNIFCTFPKYFGVDVVFGFIREKDKRFHEVVAGAKIFDIGEDISFGGDTKFYFGIWELDNLNLRFLKRVGVNRGEYELQKR